MSYILDALKRADAERERGSIPGLHAQPLPQAAEGRRTAALRPGLRPVLAAALVAAGVAAGAWIWRDRAADERHPVAASAPSSATVQAATAGRPITPPAPALPSTPPPPPAFVETAPTPMAAPNPQAMVEPPPARSAAAPLMTPPAPRSEAPAQAQPKVRLEAARPPASAAMVDATASAPRTKASAATGSAGPPASPAQAAPLPLLSELPEDIRRGIPALAVTGAVYSENPAQRLLLVNGQVLPQGAAAAQDLVIEEIRARSSVFSFRGARFRVTY